MKKPEFYYGFKGNDNNLFIDNLMRHKLTDKDYYTIKTTI